MNDGKAADGTQIADDEALRAALTPVMRSADGSPTPGSIDGRTGFYGYGMGVGTDSTGRVRLSHSGAFAQGAGTTVLAIPNLDLGIVVLTNAAANGTAEGLVNNFADIAEFGSEQQDWVAGYKRALAGVSAPALGSAVIRSALERSGVPDGQVDEVEVRGRCWLTQQTGHAIDARVGKPPPCPL